MNTNAFFSDTTQNFICPPDPASYSRVRVLFRASKDDDIDPYVIRNDIPIQMSFAYIQGVFSYYMAEVSVGTEPVEYYFRITSGEESCIFDMRGPASEPSRHYCFRIVPDYTVPSWAQGAVMYQIFVDRFCNGDRTNDVADDEYSYTGSHVKRVKDWNTFPDEYDVCNFYGGDLQGVMDKLDYLKNLGVDVIYLNPIFVSPSNHKYDTQDYEHVDPHFGRLVSDEGELLAEGDFDNTHATKYMDRTINQANLDASDELFAKLTEEIHKRGMRIILDGVFNHCGSFNRWLDREGIYRASGVSDRGAVTGEDSIYRDYFSFKTDYKGNDVYEGWWGFDTLPKLNYEGSSALVRHIMKVAEKWLKPPYSIDGWRLDVAADLGHSPHYNHLFWRSFRRNVKSVNPQALILAEHYGDPAPWLFGAEWDSVMNYDAFMDPVSWYLTGMDKHSDTFNGGLLANAQCLKDALLHEYALMPTPSLFSAMNELSNHDHSRFLTRTSSRAGRLKQLGSAAASEGVDKAVMRLGIMMQMILPGAPTVYYGDEAGVCGFTDPDNRRTYPWGAEDEELLGFYKKAIAVHRLGKEMKYGSFTILRVNGGAIAFARFVDEACTLEVINRSDTIVDMRIPVWQCGVPVGSEMTSVLYSGRDGSNAISLRYPCTGGMLDISMEPCSGIILRHEMVL